MNHFAHLLITGVLMLISIVFVAVGTSYTWSPERFPDGPELGGLFFVGSMLCFAANYYVFIGLAANEVDQP